MCNLLQNHVYRWAVVVVSLLSSTFVLYGEGQLAKVELVGLLEEAKSLFRQANEKAATDSDSATDLYRKAIMRYERIIRDGGIENGGLYYNIGNAYFRMEDIGRAILNYRRALRYLPNDPNLHQNLDHARARRLVTVEESPEKKILQTIFFWHYDMSTRIRSVLFAVFFVTIWLAAGLRIFIKRQSTVWIVGISSILAAALLTSLLIETAQNQNIKAGVVLIDAVIARKGDSESYEPSFKDPLHAGTEFTLLENRQDWYHIELVNGRECWIPKRSAELLF